jgi:hypothetical protein
LKSPEFKEFSEKIPDAMAYLETRYTTNLLYCTNISYYLLLKNNGEISMKHHPIISQLLKARNLLGNLAPLDK